MEGISLLSEANDCGRALLRLISRGHAIVVELQCVADTLPPAFADPDSVDAKHFSAVLPDFSVFRTEGALDHVLSSQELVELDEESRELHAEFASRLFHMLVAINQYALDLNRFLEDFEAGCFITYSFENIGRDEHGPQLFAEAIAMLGIMLLMLDERISGVAREQALVAYHRFTMGTDDDRADAFPDVCKLFKSSGRPEGSANMAARPRGYPERFFARFSLRPEAVRLVIGLLQTGDVYAAVKHYPLPEHRSHSLAAQGGLLYVILFFHAETLESDHVAMREIVNRHFGDAWVVAYALGHTADLTSMWAPYSAARQALSSAITQTTVNQLQERYLARLEGAQKQISEYLKEGALNAEVVSLKISALLSCLRDANTAVRWLLLQPTTENPKLQACLRSDGAKERLLRTLVDTSLLEERVRELLTPLVERRESDWAEHKAAASQAMSDLSVYFSGEHVLKRDVRNEELETWFQGLQVRIDELNYDTREDELALSRKIAQLLRALEEVEGFQDIWRQPHVLHFLGEARELLRRMVRTVNLRQETLDTITVVADLSYAWHALDGYESSMHALISVSPSSVKGLRALFLKLSSILETPLRRIRQAGSANLETFVSGYYSARLVAFMRSVLQEIPRLIFKLLAQISEHKLQRLPPRISLLDLNEYAQRSDQARMEVASLTKSVASLMRGIRETDVAVLGVIRVEPRHVLMDGLRRSLVQKIEDMFAAVDFPGMRASNVRQRDFISPLADLASASASLSRSFENVQDYVGCSAWQMWHAEHARILRFYLHMELQILVRRRMPPASSCIHFDPVCPVLFPDATYRRNRASASGSEASALGGSVLSRVAAALLAITSASATVGGLCRDWCWTASGEVALDSLGIEMLSRALGPTGLAAISRFLGFKAATRVRKVLVAITSELSGEDQGLLEAVAAQVRAGGARGDAARVVRTALQAVPSLLLPLIDILGTIGQHQLLRRRLQFALNLHARLNAPSPTESLTALNAAGLEDAMQGMGDSGGKNLPDVLDPDAQGAPEGPSDERVEESAARFHRRLAQVTELFGLEKPFRQIYVNVAEGSLPAVCSVLLGIALVAAARKAIGLASKRPRKTAQGSGACDDEFAEAGVAVAAGVATVLQQMPRVQTQRVVEFVGAYLGGLCFEAGKAGQGAESWGEGKRLASMLEAILRLLDLPPQGVLAGFSNSQSLTELWPLEPRPAK